LKVALISGYSDLGEVGSFWEKPAEYVRYLGDELSLVEQPPATSAAIPATTSSSAGSSSAWLFLVPVGLFVIAALIAIGVSRRRTAGLS
jgi:hypothetical protein